MLLQELPHCAAREQHRTLCNGLELRSCRGLWNKANKQWRSHGNLRDPVVSMSDTTRELVTTPVVSRVREDGIKNHRTRTWYCRVKETKPSETNVGKSERFDSTGKSVNPNPTGNRWREANRRNFEPLSGNTSHAWTWESVSTKRQRIATPAQLCRMGCVVTRSETKFRGAVCGNVCGAVCGNVCKHGSVGVLGEQSPKTTR